MADTMTINDTTMDVAYKGTNPNNYFGGSSIGDSIGSNFDTQKVVVTITSTSLELKYYTQFNGSDLGTNYADIFLAPALNSTSAPAAWTYGIALGDQYESAGFYSVTGTKISQQFWSGSGDIYGGLYITPDGVQHTVPVDITGGSLVGGWSLSKSITHNNGGSYPSIIDVTLTSTGGATLASLFGSSIDILWGTADCANDAIFATISTVSQVPEPMSLSLFGAGLIGGVVAYRRRKKRA